MGGTYDRRRFLLATGGATIGTMTGCLGDVTGSNDGEFPSEEIELVIPFSPGGGYDAYARLVAEHVDLPMRVANVTGAVGDIAKERVYSADPDGYTLMISSLSIYPPRQMTDDVPYDMREMTYFPQIVDEVSAIGGTPERVDGWDHFVELVNDESIRFAGSPGGQTAFISGTVGHFGDLWPPSNVFDNMVSLGGTAKIMTAIQRGDADAMAGTVSTAAQYAESGDYEFYLAVTESDAADVDGLPDDTATLSSENVAGASTITDVITQARVLVGPPEIPESRRQTLEEAFVTVLQSDEFREAATSAGRPVEVLSGPKTREKAIRTLDGLAEIEFLDEMA